MDMTGRPSQSWFSCLPHSQITRAIPEQASHREQPELHSRPARTARSQDLEGSAGERRLSLGTQSQRISVWKEMWFPPVNNVFSLYHSTWQWCILSVIPHLQWDECDNGEGDCLENGGKWQLQTTHNVSRLSQEEQQTETHSHQAEKSHKTQGSTWGLHQRGPPVFQEHDTNWPLTQQQQQPGHDH